MRRLEHALARLLVVSLAAGPLAPGALAQAVAPDARPELGQVVTGSVEIETSVGDSLTTIHATDGSIADYRSFSIGEDWNVLVEISRNGTPASDASTLVRDGSGDPTQILGSLRSNGRVFVQNPAGIIVGEGAMIDVAAFHAAAGQIDAQTFSSLSRDDYDALSGTVDVEGTIRADVVHLIGDRVLHKGSIVTSGEGGEVVIVAGEKVTILSAGFAVTIEGIADAVRELATGVELAGSIEGADAPTDRVLVGAGDLYGTAIAFGESARIEAENLRIAGQGGDVVLGDATLAARDLDLCAAADCAGGRRELADAVAGEISFGTGLLLRDPAAGVPALESLALRQTADLASDPLAVILEDLFAHGASGLDLSLESRGDARIDHSLSVRPGDPAPGGELGDLVIRAGRDLDVTASQRVAGQLRLQAAREHGAGSRLRIGSPGGEPLRLDGEHIVLEAYRESLGLALPDGTEPRVELGLVAIGDAATRRFELEQEASILSTDGLPGAGWIAGLDRPGLRAQELRLRSRLGEIEVDDALAELLDGALVSANGTRTPFESVELAALGDLDVTASLRANELLDLQAGELRGDLRVGSDAPGAPDLVLQAARVALRAGVGESTEGEAGSPRVVIGENVRFAGLDRFVLQQDAVIQTDDLPDPTRFAGLDGLDYTLDSQVDGIRLDGDAARHLNGTALTLRAAPNSTFDFARRLDLDTSLSLESLVLEGFTSLTGDLSVRDDLRIRALERRDGLGIAGVALTLDGSDAASGGARDQRLEAGGVLEIVGGVEKTSAGDLVLEARSIDLDEAGLSSRDVSVADGSLRLSAPEGIHTEGDLAATGHVALRPDGVEEVSGGAILLGGDLLLDGSPALDPEVEPDTLDPTRIEGHGQRLRAWDLSIEAGRTVEKVGGGQLQLIVNRPRRADGSLVSGDDLGVLDVAGTLRACGSLTDCGSPDLDPEASPRSFLLLDADGDLRVEGARLEADDLELRAGSLSGLEESSTLLLRDASLEARQLRMQVGNTHSDGALRVEDGVQVTLVPGSETPDEGADGDAEGSLVQILQDAPVDASSRLLRRAAISGAPLDVFRIQSQQSVVIDAGLAAALREGGETGLLDVESRRELRLEGGELVADRIELAAGIGAEQADAEDGTAGLFAESGVLRAREITLSAGDGVGLADVAELHVAPGVAFQMRPDAQGDAALTLRQDAAIDASSDLLPAQDQVTGIAADQTLALTLQSRDGTLSVDAPAMAERLSGPTRALTLRSNGLGSRGDLRVTQDLAGRSIVLDSGDDGELALDARLEADSIELAAGDALELGGRTLFSRSDGVNPDGFALRKSAGLDAKDLPGLERFAEGHVAGMRYAISSADRVSLTPTDDLLRDPLRARIEGSDLTLRGARGVEVDVGALALAGLRVEESDSTARFRGSLLVDGDVRLEAPIALDLTRESAGLLSAGGDLLATSGVTLENARDVRVEAGGDLDLSTGPLEHLSIATDAAELSLTSGGRLSLGGLGALGATDVTLRGDRVALHDDLRAGRSLNVGATGADAVIEVHPSPQTGQTVTLRAGRDLSVSSKLVGQPSDAELGDPDAEIEPQPAPYRHLRVLADGDVALEGAELARLDVAGASAARAGSVALRGELRTRTLTAQGESIELDPGTVRGDIVSLESARPVALEGTSFRRLDEDRAPRNFTLRQEDGIDDQRTGQAIAALGSQLDDTTLGLHSLSGRISISSPGSLSGLRLVLGGVDAEGEDPAGYGVQVDGDLDVDRLELASSAHLQGDLRTDSNLVVQGEHLRVAGEARVGRSLLLERAPDPDEASGPPDQTVVTSGPLSARSISKSNGSLTLGSPDRRSDVSVSGDLQVLQGGLTLHDRLAIGGDLTAQQDAQLLGAVVLTGGQDQTLRSLAGTLIAGALEKVSGGLQLSGGATDRPGVRITGRDAEGVAVRTRRGDLGIDGPFETVGHLVASGGDLSLRGGSGDAMGRLLSDLAYPEWRLSAADGRLVTTGGLDAGIVKLELESAGTIGLGGRIRASGLELGGSAIETERDTELHVPMLRLPGTVTGPGSLEVRASEGIELAENVDLGQNARLDLRSPKISLGEGVTRLAAGSISLGSGGTPIRAPGALELEAKSGSIGVGPTLQAGGRLAARATDQIRVGELRATEIDLRAPVTTLRGGSLLANRVDLSGGRVVGAATVVVPSLADYSGPESDGLLVRLTDRHGRRLTAEELAGFVASGPARRELSRDQTVASEPEDRTPSGELGHALDRAVSSRPFWAQELLSYLEEASLEGASSASAGLRDARFDAKPVAALLETYRGLFAPARVRDPATGERSVRSHAPRIRAALERVGRSCDTSTAAALSRCVQDDTQLGEARFYLATLTTLVEQADAAGLDALETARFAQELSRTLRPESVPEAIFLEALGTGESAGEGAPSASTSELAP